MLITFDTLHQISCLICQIKALSKLDLPVYSVRMGTFCTRRNQLWGAGGGGTYYQLNRRIYLTSLLLPFGLPVKRGGRNRGGIEFGNCLILRSLLCAASYNGRHLLDFARVSETYGNRNVIAIRVETYSTFHPWSFHVMAWLSRESDQS